MGDYRRYMLGTMSGRGVASASTDAGAGATGATGATGAIAGATSARVRAGFTIEVAVEVCVRFRRNPI
jgi:hypothetical protein